MTLTLHEVHGPDIEALVPLLLLAEPSERGLRWGLAHLVDSVYRFELDGATVGAATLQWHNDPPEIEELAVAPDRQRQGIGRQILALLEAEAQARGKTALAVGTANSSIGNLVFYQKSGYRIDHVRSNYFWYYQPPITENGLPKIDLIMFRKQLTEAKQTKTTAKTKGAQRKR